MCWLSWKPSRVHRHFHGEHLPPLAPAFPSRCTCIAGFTLATHCPILTSSFYRFDVRRPYPSALEHWYAGALRHPRELLLPALPLSILPRPPGLQPTAADIPNPEALTSVAAVTVAPGLSADEVWAVDSTSAGPPTHATGPSSEAVTALEQLRAALQAALRGNIEILLAWYRSSFL